MDKTIGSQEWVRSPPNSELLQLNSVCIYCIPQVYDPLTHFATHSAALDIVSEGVGVLSSTQDVLLPLIHTLWPVVVMRLDDHDKGVRLHALVAVKVGPR